MAMRNRVRKRIVRHPSESRVLMFESLEMRRMLTAGALDATFDSDGILTTHAGGLSIEQANGIAVQLDGKIVVAGPVGFDFGVVRYNSNGSLDTGFGSGGKVITDIDNSSFDDASSVAIQADGKIVVAGSSGNGANDDFALARYNTNGSLDTTFSGDGKVTTAFGAGVDRAMDLAIQTDGKIVVVGRTWNGSNQDWALARYNSDGSLDSSFDGDGKVTTAFVAGVHDHANSVVLQPDGKIVVAGNTSFGVHYDFALARYNSDGSLDANFDGDGKLTTDFGSSADEAVNSVALLPDGRIVAAGYTGAGSSSDFALARYNANGSLDSSFDGDGKVTTNVGGSTDEIFGLALQTDGKMVVAGQALNGSFSDFALARYNFDGGLDTSFDADGKVTHSIGSGDDQARGIAIQSDGKIVAAGYSLNGSDSDIALARYLGDVPGIASNLVWNDLNGNGIRDAGEPGIPGVTVSLYTQPTGGVAIATTTSDSNAAYSFGGLDPGTYYVEVTLPGGYILAPKDRGSDDSLDSDFDPTTRRSGAIVLTAGNVTSIDAGMYQPVKIEGQKFNDLNDDGIRNTGASPEPFVPGWTVYVDLNNNSALDNGEPSTVTDANGHYEFNTLVAGSYTIRESQLAGWRQTYPVNSTTLLQDNFNDNSINSSLWSVNTNIQYGGASVTEKTSRMELKNRGHLITKQDFAPLTSGPLRITGIWTFSAGGSDFMQVLTRSDGVPQSGAGETTNGIEFHANEESDSLSINSRVGGSANSLTAAVPLTINAGETFTFVITDDGTNLSLSMDRVGGGASASIMATSSLQFSSNRIVFHNREFLYGTDKIAYMDNLVVARNVPIGHSVTLTAGQQATGLDFGNHQILPSVPPTANAGGPYSVGEGDVVVLSASGASSSGPVTFAWDLDGDGNFGETGPAAARGIETGAAPSFNAGSLNGPATVTVTVRVIDSGGAITTATSTVSVANVSPTAAAGGPYTIAEGSTALLTGTGSDPVDNLTFAWDLDGDGAFGETGPAAARGDETGASPAFNAVALSGPATLTAKLRVTDSEGASSTSTATISVTNVPPTANAGGPYSVVEGSSLMLSGSGTDPVDAVSLIWDLDGDGTFGETGAAAGRGNETGPSPTFTTAIGNATSTATVTLRVTDANGASTTSTATVAIGPASLHVIALTPTSTGFVAQFNRDLDPSALNLYDQGGALGAADVTLIGSATSDVRGSVVAGPGARAITFIKSGGILNPDFYTVVLRSAVDGFKDTLGELLDGDANGVRGDSYSANFSVLQPSLNAVTVGIPDVTRGYGQTVNVPATATTGIPVTISTGQGVSGVDFTLRYDPALLAISAVSLAPGITGALDHFSPSAGVLNVTISGAAELSSSAGLLTLVNLTAQVPSTAPYASKHVLDITNLHVFDDSEVPQELPSIDNDGIHIAALFGDSNGSQTYNSPDATLAQRIIVGANTGFSAYQLADPYLIADITNNGAVQSNDVTLIQRAIVGTFGLIPAPSVLPAPSEGGPDPLVFIPKDLTGAIGQTVSVPVQLLVTESGGVTLSGVDLAIAYDPTKMQLSSVRVGLVTSGFGLNVNDSTPGLIQVSLAGGVLSLPHDSAGSLVVLNFTIFSGAGTSTGINLLESFATLRSALYDNEGRALTLAPQPTNDLDELDGALRVRDELFAAWDPALGP